MKLRIIGVVICLSVSLFNLSSCSQTKSIQKDTTTTSNTYDPFNKSGDYLQSQMSYLKKRIW